MTKLILIFFLSLSAYAESSYYISESKLLTNGDAFVTLASEDATPSPLFVKLKKKNKKFELIKIPKNMKFTTISFLHAEGSNVLAVTREFNGDATPGEVFIQQKKKWKNIGKTKCADFLVENVTGDKLTYSCFPESSDDEEKPKKPYTSVLEIGVKFNSKRDRKDNRENQKLGENTLLLEGPEYFWTHLSYKGQKFSAQQIIDNIK